MEAVEEITVPLLVPKLAPFTAFLSDLHDAMHAAYIYAPGINITKDLETDRATWKKKYNGGNEARARALIEALRLYVQAGHQPPAVLVDDAGGITQSMTPVLVGLAAHAVLVLAVYPETLQKAGTRRLWQLCDRVELPQLDGGESRTLVGSLTAAYGITTPDMKAYENAVLALSSGIPGEIVRLVRYVPVWRNCSAARRLGAGPEPRRPRGARHGPRARAAGAQRGVCHRQSSGTGQG